MLLLRTPVPIRPSTPIAAQAAASGTGVTVQGSAYDGGGGSLLFSIGDKGFSICFGGGVGLGGEFQLDSSNRTPNGPFASAKVGRETEVGPSVHLGGAVRSTIAHNPADDEAVLEGGLQMGGLGPNGEFDLITGEGSAGLRGTLVSESLIVRIDAGICLGTHW